MPDVADMRQAANVVSEVLKTMRALALPGVSLETIDRAAGEKIAELGAESANKGYKPGWAPVAYPAFTCLSINNVVSHGIPGTYVLEEGDIVKLDVGVKVRGTQLAMVAGDAGFTVPVGTVSNKAARIIRYANKCMDEALKVVRDGVHVDEISRVIERTATEGGYRANPQYMGHGIGNEMHEKPSIPNRLGVFDHKKALQDPILHEGQVICIEPIISEEDRKAFRQGRSLDPVMARDSDGWTIFHPDGQLCAFAEHMVLVTKDGCEVLTKW